MVRAELHVTWHPVIPSSVGHIYAAGALLGLCHDYIVMNDSRGFFCLPEVCTATTYSSNSARLLQVNLKLNFPAAWTELVCFTNKCIADFAMLSQSQNSTARAECGCDTGKEVWRNRGREGWDCG